MRRVATCCGVSQGEQHANDCRILAIETRVQSKRAATAELMASTPRPIEMQRGAIRGPVLVSPCMTDIGKWRVTRFFLDLEPFGHSTCQTFPDAVKLACCEGADPLTATDPK